jgi:hypothetical protein
MLVCLRLPDVNLIPLCEVEASTPGLIETKSARSLIEYYFTFTPCLPLFILERLGAETVTYLDADLFFFADPQSIFDEIGTRSIAIVPHRWTADRMHMVKFGIYNISWLTFRSDQRGMSCLRWYRNKCLEWCYDRPEDGRLADQKYLDDWPERFEGVVALNHKGANLASWNLENYRITEREGKFFVDTEPLIFFHFHGLTFRGEEPDPYNISIKDHYFQDHNNSVRTICELYLKAVHNIENKLERLVGYIPPDPLRGKKLPTSLPD